MSDKTANQLQNPLSVFTGSTGQWDQYVPVAIASAKVAAKDTELLDWAETDVIAISAHLKGWEVIYAGADGEPAMEDAKLFEVETIREALALAWEEQKALFAAQAAGAGEVPVSDVPEAQLRFVGGAIVDDAGGD